MVIGFRGGQGRYEECRNTGGGPPLAPLEVTQAAAVRRSVFPPTNLGLSLTQLRTDRAISSKSGYNDAPSGLGWHVLYTEVTRDATEHAEPTTGHTVLRTDVLERPGAGTKPEEDMMTHVASRVPASPVLYRRLRQRSRPPHRRITDHCQGLSGHEKIGARVHVTGTGCQRRSRVPVLVSMPWGRGRMYDRDAFRKERDHRFGR